MSSDKAIEELSSTQCVQKPFEPLENFELESRNSQKDWWGQVSSGSTNHPSHHIITVESFVEDDVVDSWFRGEYAGGARAVEVLGVAATSDSGSSFADSKWPSYLRPATNGAPGNKKARMRQTQLNHSSAQVANPPWLLLHHKSWLSPLTPILPQTVSINKQVSDQILFLCITS